MKRIPDLLRPAFGALNRSETRDPARSRWHPYHTDQALGDINSKPTMWEIRNGRH
jgi:hypothetical protein